MRQRAIKIALTTVVLLGAFTGLLYSTLRDGTEYYKHVDEVMVKPADWYGKRLQLHGFVVKESVLRRRDSLDYKFRIENNGSAVDARYTGVVPDTFKGGSEVVLKGTLGPGGFDVAPNGVMAKCPSKYDPNKPTGQ
jgi:cytochrome c-type biogenesis protein CcmE